jgi:hypothetical protein
MPLALSNPVSTMSGADIMGRNVLATCSMATPFRDPSRWARAASDSQCACGRVRAPRADRSPEIDGPNRTPTRSIDQAAAIASTVSRISRAVLDRAAPGVDAHIANRLQKLVMQITVRGMQLHTIEARRARTSRRRREV